MAGDRHSNAVGTPARGSDPAAVLDLCDRLLAEVSRRRHLFSWLRAPGAQTWLPVDAYYPSHRLVVLYRERPGEHDRLYREVIPAHGLHVLELHPAELGQDPEPSLRRLIEALGLPPRHVFEAPAARLGPRDGPGARMSASLMQAIAPPERRRPPGRQSSGHRAPASSGRRAPAAEPPPSLALGVAVGLALALAIAIELFVGVGNIALGNGHWLLAFGLALDAVSRALGTVAAERAGEAELTWWCALGGSPVVAAFTLFGRNGRVDVEPGPIAGLVSVLALAVIGLALIGILLGI